MVGCYWVLNLVVCCQYETHLVTCRYVLTGVGFGMVIISAVVCVYYNVIIAWTVYYFVLSFAWELPWSTCNNDWNTPNCYTRSGNNSNFTNQANITDNKTRSPSEEFFELVP